MPSLAQPATLALSVKALRSAGASGLMSSPAAYSAKTLASSWRVMARSPEKAPLPVPVVRPVSSAQAAASAYQVPATSVKVAASATAGRPTRLYRV